jgi:PelA/Pel-15E family pectate lyase
MSWLSRRSQMLLLIASLAFAQTSPAAVRWGGEVLKQKPEWYATDEAQAAADNVLRYQSKVGAWPKNTDLFAPSTDSALAEIRNAGKEDTLDNGATTLPMRFLAMMGNAASGKPYHAAVVRGLDYLFEAQYPNGGFPQFFPLRPNGYYSHITYNDGAMVNALELLRDVAERRAPFGFVDAARRAKAADAVARGINCILKTQIRQDGGLTAWCAQHDAKTLDPAWGRAYEPPSLSGGESVGIVLFLMAVQKPSPDMVAAIEGAVTWFRRVPITGQRLDEVRGRDGRKERILVADPAAPPLWARFYELGSNRPLYMDRDSRPNYDFMKVSHERRSGYGYHSRAPASLLERDYPDWREKQGRTP